LLIATILSVLLTGTLIAAGETGLRDSALGDAIANNPIVHLWRGTPYAFAIMLILGSHELGHYFTMRRYGLAGSLPYFLPAPLISPFGTFGAAIVLRDSLRSRNMLFDLGASGPIAGMVFAVPILLIGLATSPVMLTGGGIVEGNSILYAAAKIITLGEFLPANGRDVLLNQFAWAGWTGFFVTALNLIPLGQLDGGHILYALLGDSARRLYAPLLGIMVALTLFVSQVWLVFAVLLMLVGRFYAVPLDDVTPLSPRRQQIGIAVLVMFALIFTPIPIGEYGVNNGLLAGLLATVGLWHWRGMVKI
jgi:membrane-associated protease RseP (regulator of RpoE activity)